MVRYTLFDSARMAITWHVIVLRIVQYANVRSGDREAIDNRWWNYCVLQLMVAHLLCARVKHESFMYLLRSSSART